MPPVAGGILVVRVLAGQLRRHGQRARGRTAAGDLTSIRITPETTPGGNPAFDVTPAHLVTALITERGVCDASGAGLAALFPEAAAA